MKFKRILSIVLLAAMLLSVASGCAGTPSSSSSSSSSSTPAPADDKDLAKVGYALTDEEVDDYFFMNRKYVLDASQLAVTDKEMEKAGKWLTDHILEASAESNAFDFQIDGKSFREDIASWTVNTEKTGETDDAVNYLITYTKSGEVLTVKVEAAQYKEYPIVEWTVWIENTGSDKSGQLSEFGGIDMDLGSESVDGEFRFTAYRGSYESTQSFKVVSRVLEEGKARKIAASGGKPTAYSAPYMNIQWNNNEAEWGLEGIMISCGWPAQWRIVAEDLGSTVHVFAGQERFDTYLNPGESVRSPLMSLLFWEKDFMRSQNIWRDWVYNVVMPQPDGEPIPTMVHGNTAQDTALTEKATTENQVEAIEKWQELGLITDAWQMDAGWYDTPEGSTGWVNTGSWTPSIERFNGSLKTIADTLDKYNMDFVLWNEPERIVAGSEWYERFAGTDFAITQPGQIMFNLANDEAVDWLIDFQLNQIKNNGVDIYRQDCNFVSLNQYWDSTNTDGRTGYVENRYVVGYLRYFDAILEATGTFIDNCAAGGKRQDIESLRRSAALWRDDACYDALLTQSQSWGINFFIPYSGQGSLDQDPTMIYTSRSNMMPYTGLPWRLSKINESNIEMHKQVIAEHAAYAPYMTADYYPLSPFSDSDEDWLAWQFNERDGSAGMIQVFKRMSSSSAFKLYYPSGLQADATYVFEDVDTHETFEATGLEIMQRGLTISINDEFAAKIFEYKVK